MSNNGPQRASVLFTEDENLSAFRSPNAKSMLHKPGDRVAFTVLIDNSTTRNPIRIGKIHSTVTSDGTHYVRADDGGIYGIPDWRLMSVQEEHTKADRGAAQ